MKFRGGNNLIFKDGGGTYKDSLWTFINMYMDKRQSFKEIQELLNSEVILVEDNIEEIEEIPQYRIDNCTDYNYCYLAEKYNKLAKAVNQIRKDLNK